jgi:hypothetical protein
MRCSSCFRIETAATCRHCGSPSFLSIRGEATESRSGGARSDGSVRDPGLALLDRLAAGDADPDELFELLGLTLCLPGSSPVDERLAEVSALDLGPAERVLLALYVARARGDHGAAARLLVAVLAAANEAILPLGSRILSAQSTEVGTRLMLQRLDDEVELGVLDPECGGWVECHLDEVDLAPRQWEAWKSLLGRRRDAAVALLAALEGGDRGPGQRTDSGFRFRWKDFQHALGEQRDRLAGLEEADRLRDALAARNRGFLNSVEVARCVSSLVEAARNSLRLCADRMREAHRVDLDKRTQEAVEEAFIGGGLDEVAALRGELEREAGGAHAEMRKALDYQSRLLRRSQEGLHASLSDLVRRAGGMMWSFTPRANFDEAVEQVGLIVERAREVAMIEQTDGWLQDLSSRIESRAAEVQQGLLATRPLIARSVQELERICATLGVEATSMEPLDDPRQLRKRATRMAATADGLRRVLEQIELKEREAVLV